MRAAKSPFKKRGWTSASDVCILASFFGSLRAIIFFEMSDGQLEIFEEEGVSVLKTAWVQALERLSNEVPETAHKRFIQPLKPLSLSDGSVRVSAPGNFVAEWVRDRYVTKIEQALGDELGETVVVKLVVETKAEAKGGYSRSSASLCDAHRRF